MAEVGVPKIYSAIAGVIADIGIVAKDKVNKQQGFKFRSIDDVYNALHPALAKHKVFIVPLIIDRKREVIGKTQRGGDMVLVTCRIKFTFYAEDGSHVESIIVGEGMDTGDKGTNKAMAIAYKYACFQVFCIPTEEMVDPDGERPELDEKNTAKKQPGTNKAQGSTAKSQQTAAKAQEPEKQQMQEASGSDRITEAMLKTIQSEQERTGVTNEQILGMKKVTAKKIEEMTIEEFNVVMSKFEKTPDLKKGDA